MTSVPKLRLIDEVQEPPNSLELYTSCMNAHGYFSDRSVQRFNQIFKG